MIDLDPEPHFVDIYTHIGTNWKDLARKLNIKENIIKIIEADKQNTNDRCYEMLYSYRTSAGKDFTKIVLVSALFAAGLRSVAEDNLCKVKMNENVIANQIGTNLKTKKYEYIVFVLVVITSALLYRFNSLLY